jgi:RNA polymerase sigma factor (sigma-70 family)
LTSDHQGEGVAMDRQEGLASQLEEQRPRLRGLAYRMLGSVSDAEDAVQEAWLRLSRADTRDREAIEDLAAWLTTVVARICLNQLRTRATRREESLEVRMPDPVVTAPSGADPEGVALLADSVGLALLVVLDELAPAERLAFVLHDVFGVPFDEIAGLVDRSPTAARQLASRARRRVRSRPTTSDDGAAAQGEVVEAFFAAGRSGDFHRLISVLDPDVVLRADFGAARAGLPGTAVGAADVAGRALMFAGAQTVVPATVNGQAGVVIVVGGRPVSVMGFTVVGGRVAAIDVLGDPERLARLDLSALGELT